MDLDKISQNPIRITRNYICVKYNILKEKKDKESFEDTVKRLLKKEKDNAKFF